MGTDRASLKEALAWMDKARCRGAPLEKFFTEERRPSDATYAVIAEYCDPCPVRMECLVYALTYEVSFEARPFGIWGGTFPVQRTKMKSSILKGSSFADAIASYIDKTDECTYQYNHIEVRDSNDSVIVRA